MQSEATRPTLSFAETTGGLATLFIVADLLFLPRLLPIFGIPISLLVVGTSLVRLELDSRRAMAILLLLTCILISVFAGSLTGANPDPADSLKRALQLTAILLYSLYKINDDLNVGKVVLIFRCFYIYVFGLCLLSYVSPGSYESFIIRVYPEAADALQSNMLFRRFAYVFADPNSAGYFLSLTLVPYLALEKRTFYAVLMSVLAALVIAATQSRGAYIGLVMIMGYKFFYGDARPSVRLTIALIIIAAAAAIYATYYSEIEFAFKVFEERLRGETDVGGGRAGKYAYFLANLNFWPFGTGYHLLRDSIIFRPHSDFIRLNLSYGILATPLFFYLIWPHQKKQILLFFIALLPLFINSLIDDFRLLGGYLIFQSLLIVRHRD